MDDSVTQLVGAFVNKNWDSHYRASWTKLGSPTGLRSGTSWNWPAALFTVPWLAYRKRQALALGVLVAAIVAGSVPFLGLIVWIATFVGFGLYGDRIVLGRGWQSADGALRQYGPGEQATKTVAAAGGISISALIVFAILPATLVVAIIALIVIPKFSVDNNRLYLAQMKSDLRNLNTAEETYFADSSKYTTNLGRLFVSTVGVSAPTITLTAKGYTATVTHNSAPGKICGIGVEAPNPVAPAGDGEPVCK